MPQKDNTRRSDGLIAVQVYLGKVNGKRKYKPVYGKSQREADKKAREVKNQLDAGIDMLTPNSTFSVCVNKWLDYKKAFCSDSQYKLYKYRVTFFLENIKDKPVNKITLSELQVTVNSLALKNPATNKPTSSRTLMYYITTIRQFYEWMIDNRFLSFNPARNLSVPKRAPKSKERRALTSEEQQRVIEFEHRAKPAAMIAMYAGLRRGEITALEWSDIDFKQNTISVNKAVDLKSKTIKLPKTAAGYRTVPMPDELSGYLKTIKSKGLVFPNTEGQMMSEQAWQRLWNYYMNAMNRTYGDLSKWKPDKHHKKPPMVIEPFTMHCLRHTYATILYDAGVDILTAKKLLGHSDIKTTLGIYTHLSQEKEKLNIDKLNEFLNKK